MLALSLAIVPLLVIPLIVRLPHTVHTTFAAVEWLVWAAFAVEYGVRLYLAPHKRAFVRRNVIDLVVVVVPFLRPLRIMRSARALRALRAARASAFLFRGAAAVRDVLSRHNLHYALVVTIFVVTGAAVLVKEFERGLPGANITTLADALWWSVATVTTVGFGDRFPISAPGRGVAVALMVLGVGMFGLLAASLASYFVESRGHAQRDVTLADLAEQLDRIERRLRNSS
jgi:voltage-gated potassium channel